MRVFEAARPRLLGALLDAVSIALRRNLPETRRTTVHKPRMADAYMFARSGSPSPELLSIAWSRTAQEAMATTLESSLIAAPLRLLVGDGEWCGTATVLLEQLTNRVPETITRRREWPKTPRAVAAEGRRIAPALRAAGIDHTEGREPQTGSRLHTFTRTKPEACVTSVTTVTDPITTMDFGDDRVTQLSHPQEISVTSAAMVAAFVTQVTMVTLRHRRISDRVVPRGDSRPHELRTTESSNRGSDCARNPGGSRSPWCAVSGSRRPP